MSFSESRRNERPTLYITGQGVSEECFIFFQICLPLLSSWCPGQQARQQATCQAHVETEESVLGKERLPSAPIPHTLVRVSFLITSGGTVQPLTGRGVRELGLHGPTSYPISDPARVPRVFCRLWFSLPQGAARTPGQDGAGGTSPGRTTWFPSPRQVTGRGRSQGTGQRHGRVSTPFPRLWWWEGSHTSSSPADPPALEPLVWVRWRWFAAGP